MATINYEYGSRPIYTLSQAVAKFLFYDNSNDNSMPPENMAHTKKLRGNNICLTFRIN